MILVVPDYGIISSGCYATMAVSTSCRILQVVSSVSQQQQCILCYGRSTEPEADQRICRVVKVY